MSEQGEASLAALGRRFRCALPVTLRRRSQDLDLLTGDVSVSGAFVRSSDCPPKNSLVRLVFTLPPDDTKLTVSCSVLHIVSTADRNPNEYPGFAVQFVGFVGAAKDRWEQLVRPLSRDPGAERKKTLVFAAPGYVERFRSKAAVAVELELRPTIEQLGKVIDDEIPKGTVFVPTHEAVAPGPTSSCASCTRWRRSRFRSKAPRDDPTRTPREASTCASSSSPPRDARRSSPSGIQ